MQIWPPKDLVMVTMTDDTLIRGVTMRQFNEILKRGFAKMYARNHANIRSPDKPRNIE